MNPLKKADAAHPVQQLILRRWSPYAFADRPVSDDDLRSLFEAARWSASSFNDQPWRYIVATKANAAEYERVLSCLTDGNRVWAKAAPVLALGCTSLNLTLTGQPNAAAEHDLGLASANLVLEATARGLSVHQMIGILPDTVRELYGIPTSVRPLTALAIGYCGDLHSFPENLRVRDLAERTRKPLSEFVFGGQWGLPSDLAK
jgi:nitroreductase